MSDSDFELHIGADAGGLEAGVGEGVAAVHELGEAATGLGATLDTMGQTALAAFERVTLGAQSARIAVMEMGESFKAARELVSDLGEAMLAAFAVEAITKFAEKMGETAEKTFHTAETFGLTVAEVQKMNAQAALFGVPADAMATAMMRLDKSFLTAKEGSTQQANAFKQLGVDLHGSYTQTELMSAALAGLAKMDAGPAKVAAAMELFGRNIQAIGPLLGLTTQQIEDASAQIDHYGAVNETAAAKGLALAESQNQGKVAMMGLNNVLTNALAPTFKALTDDLNSVIAAFVRSYNSGGIVHTMLDGLVDAFKVLIEIIDTGVTIIKLLVDALGGLAALFNDSALMIEDIFGAAVTAVTAKLKAMGRVLMDVFTGNWGDLAAAGMAAWVAGNEAAHNQVKAAAEAATRAQSTDYKNMLDKMGNDTRGWVDRQNELFGEVGAKAALPGAGKGTTADDPNANAKKAGRDKDYQDKIAHDLEKLAADRDYYDQEEADFAQYLSDVAAKYGTQSAQYAEAKTKQINYERTYWDALIREVITGLNRRREEHEKAIDAETRATQKGVADQLAATKSGIAEQIAAVKEQFQDGDIGRAQEWAEIEALHAKEAAAEEVAAQKTYQASLTALNEKIALDKADGVSTETLEAQKLALWMDYYSKLAQLSANAARQQVQDQTAAMKEMQAQISPYVSAFTSGMLQMAEGTRSFQQVMLSMGQRILEDFVSKTIDPMVTKWVAGMAQQAIATVTGQAAKNAALAAGTATGMGIQATANIAQQTHNAGVAAGGAYASLSQIPIIGPSIAPGVAAGVFGAVEGFAVAEGGYDIPSGTNPLTQLHQEEMVLPAHLANPLRDMLGGFPAANQNAPAAGNDDPGATGGIHLHVHAIDGPGTLAHLRAHPDEYATAIGEYVRGGRGPKMGIVTG